MNNEQSLIKKFLGYTINPKIAVGQKPRWQVILFNVVRLWGLVFLLSMFFALISNILLTEFGYGEEDFAITQIVMDFPYLLILFLVVVWAPFSEEIAFRLWLRFSPFNWALGLGFVALFLTALFEVPFFPENYFVFDSWVGTLSSILLVFFVGSIIYSLLSIERIASLVKKFFHKNFKYFFYTLALLFGAMHIANYDVDLKQIWYFAPILVFPQIFLSFAISFIRMNYGFSWAIFTHALNNVVAITPVLFFLPLLEKMDSVSFEETEFLEIFSINEVILILGVFSFLSFIFMVCIFSVISLVYEMVKKN